MKYLAEGRWIWQMYVPARGQADTVQGELLRAVEKLRDEAARNGNMNWNDGHEMLADFLRLTLLESDVFDEAARSEISADMELISDVEMPDSSGESYDRLADRVVEWCRAHLSPVPHPNNPQLRI